jgi:hypothetical protein
MEKETIAITSDIVTEICGYIRSGASLETAALAAGYKGPEVVVLIKLLTPPCSAVWGEFLNDINKAKAQFEVIQLMKINAEGGSKGAQWLLERNSLKGKQPNEPNPELIDFNK